MRKRTLTVWLSILAISLVTLVGSLGFAQQGGGGGNGGGGNGGGGGRRGGGGGAGGGGGMGGGAFDPAAMMQRMADGVKTQLGATDEEWKVIEPLWTKVATLQRQEGTGMMGMMRRGGRGGRGGQGGAADAGAAPTPAPPTIASMGGLPEADALQKVLDDANAKPEDIKAKLDAYRAALKKVQDQLKTAREDLRKVLTPKQEAQLVLSGTLD